MGMVCILVAREQRKGLAWTFRDIPPGTQFLQLGSRFLQLPKILPPTRDQAFST
jgi:hypothetical protein